MKFQSKHSHTHFSLLTKYRQSKQNSIFVRLFGRFRLKLSTHTTSQSGLFYDTISFLLSFTSIYVFNLLNSFLHFILCTLLELTFPITCLPTFLFFFGMRTDIFQTVLNIHLSVWLYVYFTGVLLLVGKGKGWIVVVILYCWCICIFSVKKCNIFIFTIWKCRFCREILTEISVSLRPILVK